MLRYFVLRPTAEEVLEADDQFVRWREDFVEEKFHKENFRVLSEMRILAKIKVVILDFVGYIDFLPKFYTNFDFRF